MRLPVALCRISNRYRRGTANRYYRNSGVRSTRRGSHRIRHKQGRSTRGRASYVTYHLGSKTKQERCGLGPCKRQRCPRRKCKQRPLVTRGGGHRFLYHRRGRRTGQRASGNRRASSAFMEARRFSLIVLRVTRGEIRRQDSCLHSVLRKRRRRAVQFFMVSRVKRARVFAGRRFIRVTTRVISGVRRRLVNKVKGCLPRCHRSRYRARPLQVALGKGRRSRCTKCS